MINILFYILQCSIVFSSLYLIYRILFSKFTFHGINRFLLLSIPLLSLSIPFVDVILPEVPYSLIQIPDFNELVFASKNMTNQLASDSKTEIFTLQNLVLVVYTIGAFIILLKLFSSIWKVKKLIQQSSVNRQKGYQLVSARVPEVFSVFNMIFIPKKQTYQEDDLVIKHERAHIQLRHALDLILIELYIVFFWCNPLVYLYRKSLKEIHEYQADAMVLNNNIKKSIYLKVLLKNLEVKSANYLYSYFKQPTIKKRVEMITKTPSHSGVKLSYLFFIIVISILSLGFTKHAIGTEFKELPSVDTFIDMPSIILNQKPSLFPVKNGSKKDITAFFGKSVKQPNTGKEIIHQGIDIRAKLGAPVIATADGLIAKAANDGNWGNLIVIAHSNGYQTWYAHLNGFNIEANDHVKKGDVIGYVGSTGLSKKAHLHYEVRFKEQVLNPLDFINE